MINTIKNSIIIILVAVVLYVALLVVAFIPNSETMVVNAEGAMNLFKQQPTYPVVFSVNETDIVADNFSDTVMIMATIKEDAKNLFEQALSPFGRTHYWDGYLVWLRPLLGIMSYSAIRYLNVILLVCLLILSSVLIKKRLNFGASLAYILSVCFCYITAIPSSLHYIQVFFIMMLAISFVCLFQNKLTSKNSLPPFFCYVFLIVGSITCYFDILSTPLITLGFPLVVCVLMLNKNSETSFFNVLKFVVIMSVFWVVGYAVTWGFKWILAAIFLDTDIFEYVREKFLRYGSESEQHPESFNEGFLFEVIKINFNLYFNSIALTIYGVVSCVAVFLALFFRKTKKQIISGLPIIVVSLYSFMWYFVGSSHSHIHSFFTFRTFSVFAFAFLAFLMFCVDGGKFKNALNNSKIANIINKTLE